MKFKVPRKGGRGRQVCATKRLVSVRLSPQVIAYFKRGGAGWQTRLDQALCYYVAVGGRRWPLHRLHEAQQQARPSGADQKQKLLAPSYTESTARVRPTTAELAALLKP